MPANARSLVITDRYRERLRLMQRSAAQNARAQWQQVTLDDLDATTERWAGSVALLIEETQRGSVNLTAAYIAAYVGSELGRAQLIPTITQQVGIAEDGRPLVQALDVAKIGTRVALKAGHDSTTSLDHGLGRGVRLAIAALAFAPRAALVNGMKEHERVVGWRRVTFGGCGACLAAATGAIHATDELLEVHDNCQCTMEPVVRDVPDRERRPTGEAMFAALSPAEQDRRLGPKTAEMIRSGQASFADLITHSPMATVPDQITQAPLHAL